MLTCIYMSVLGDNGEGDIDKQTIIIIAIVLAVVVLIIVAVIIILLLLLYKRGSDSIQFIVS